MLKTEETALDPQLTYEQKQAIRQAAANLALSGLRPSSQAIRDAEAVARGEKTEEQVLQETIERYRK